MGFTFDLLNAAERPVLSPEEEELLNKLGIDQSKMDNICQLYVNHADLEPQLSKVGMATLLRELGIACGTFSDMYLNAFDQDSTGKVDFRQTLLALACMDPHTPHNIGDDACERRMKYIFKFYDADRDGMLNHDELRVMIRHAKYARREPHGDEDVDKAVAELEEKVSPPIAFGAFRNAIMAGKLRGSSSLWRVGKSPFEKPKPKGYYGAPPSYVTGEGEGEEQSGEEAEEQAGESSASHATAATASSSTKETGGSASAPLSASGDRILGKYEFEELARAEQPRFKALEQDFLDRVSLSRAQLEKAVNHFVEVCGEGEEPRYLNVDKVGQLVSKFGINGGAYAQQYFRAFDRDDSGQIDFRQAVLAMAAMDPSTPHNLGDVCFEERLQYTFRFYDADGDQHLNDEEMAQMFRHIRAARQQDTSPDAVKEVIADLQRKLCIDQGAPLTFDDFRDAVIAGNLRGSASLFRVPISPFS